MASPMVNQDLREANDLAKDVYAAVEDAELTRSPAMLEKAQLAVARLQAKLDLAQLHMDLEARS